MNDKERTILKGVVEHHKGLLSPADLISSIAQGDQRSVENLVARKYLEEVHQEKHGPQGPIYSLNFYRATEKGLVEFESWSKKFWFYFKGDIRTILVSAITAVIAALVTILIGKN